jgi:hypothetical protein
MRFSSLASMRAKSAFAFFVMSAAASALDFDCFAWAAVFQRSSPCAVGRALAFLRHFCRRLCRLEKLRLCWRL